MSTPEHLAQRDDIFERALALDPENIDAMVGTALSMCCSRVPT